MFLNLTTFQNIVCICGVIRGVTNFMAASWFDWTKNAMLRVIFFAVGITFDIFYLIEKNCSFCIVNTCKMFSLNGSNPLSRRFYIKKWWWWNQSVRSLSLSLQLKHVVLMFLLPFHHSGTAVFFFLIPSSTNEFTVIVITESCIFLTNTITFRCFFNLHRPCHRASHAKVLSCFNSRR